ncbi:MAG: hypothetical protein ACYTG0_36530 [Planctomycetota bacterium]
MIKISFFHGSFRNNITQQRTRSLRATATIAFFLRVFVVHVGKVSHSGLLRIWIDEDLAAERELPCAEGLGKESVWREQWKLWETTYDEDIAVAVPAGRHRLRIENFGKGWVAVTKYAFTCCRVVDKPDVLACGMKTPELAMLWLQNKRSSWCNHAGGGQVGRMDAFELTAEGLRDGKYRLEWWETWKGRLERVEEIEVREGRLTLIVPGLTTDVALKVKPLRDGRAD